jgi:hypothetical protein
MLKVSNPLNNPKQLGSGVKVIVNVGVIVIVGVMVGVSVTVGVSVNVLVSVGVDVYQMPVGVGVEVGAMEQGRTRRMLST